MTPEQLHISKLKELGYHKEEIEKLVKKYHMNNTYLFARDYHKEMIKQKQ